MTRLITFVGLAFGFSWAYWGWMIATGQVVEPTSPASHLPGLMGPAFAAFVTVAIFDGRAGLARMSRLCLTIPKARAFAAIAILLPLLLAAVTLTVTADPFPDRAALLAYPGIRSGMPVGLALLAILVLNGYGEEVGWRGELLPTLRTRLGPIAATLAMAAIWALWHLPLFMVNASMTGLIGPALAGWIIGLTLGSFVLAHLWSVTGGSLLAVALWHSTYNLSVATAATQGLSAAVVSTLVMIWGVVIVVLWWRRPV